MSVPKSFAGLPLVESSAVGRVQAARDRRRS